MLGRTFGSFRIHSRGRSSAAEHQLPKLRTRVRFSSPALKVNVLVSPQVRPSSRSSVDGGRIGRRAIRVPFAIEDFPDHPVERLRDDDVAITRCVLVDQRGTCRRVTHARHQLLRARTGGGGERVAGVAQIVDAEPGWHAELLRGRMPRRVERRPAERTIARPTEHERVGIITNRHEVLAQLVDDQPRAVR